MPFVNNTKHSASWAGNTKHIYNDELLMENGSYLLLESGDKILIKEDVVDFTNNTKNSSTFTNNTKH